MAYGGGLPSSVNLPGPAPCPSVARGPLLALRAVPPSKTAPVARELLGAEARPRLAVACPVGRGAEG